MQQLTICIAVVAVATAIIMTAVDHVELHTFSTSASPISASEDLPPQQQLDDTTGSSNASIQKQVRRHYLSLVGIAILLTILTPRTKLWSSSSCRNFVENYRSSQQVVNSTLYDGLDNSSARYLADSSNSSEQQENDIGSCIYYGSLNIQALLIQIMWIIALVVSFNYLQGSNPGVLTKEIMEQLDVVEEEEENSFAYENEAVGNNDGLERRNFLEPPTPSSSSPLDLATMPDNNISQDKHPDTLYRSTRRKYCDKCQFYPPLRSHHCSTCNACIATFDHHCHFLGTCIGERNHWRFWWFIVLNIVAVKTSLDIVSSSSLTVSAFVYGSNATTTSSDDVKLALGTAIKIIAKLYMYPIFFIATILLTIHTLLAIGNCTTFEFTKGADHIDYLRGTRVMDFPFGRDGLLKNIIIFFRRDDAYQSLCLRSNANIDCNGSKKPMNNRWVPIVWKVPEVINRESEEWWHHPMENKYWKCC